MNHPSDPSSFADAGELHRLALELVASGEVDKALKLVRAAIKARPADALVRAIAHFVFADGVEGFHADMLRDDARNRVYAQAIAAAAPGRRVLDIGTGSGLLAMMAARAGAEHVYACEADPRLAQTAREIVETNGLSDRVTVLSRHSTALDRDRDLGGPVDLVVSEVFSQDLLSEGVLSTLADARARLCRPDATFLPGKATICVALAEFAGTDPLVGVVEGFDLTLFNRHVAAQENVRQGRRDLTLRSASADLFGFDFSGVPPMEGRARLELVSGGGWITGVVQWIRFETAPGLTYENAPKPGGELSHWVLLHHQLPTPLETSPGEIVAVHGWYSNECLLVWCGD